MHGGSLVLSDREGEGATARILFPVDTIVSKGNKPVSSTSSADSPDLELKH